jgi:hypothetical protein
MRGGTTGEWLEDKDNNRLKAREFEDYADIHD